MDYRHRHRFSELEKDKGETDYTCHLLLAPQNCKDCLPYSERWNWYKCLKTRKQMKVGCSKEGRITWRYRLNSPTYAELEEVKATSKPLCLIGICLLHRVNVHKDVWCGLHFVLYVHCALALSSLHFLLSPFLTPYLC